MAYIHLVGDENVPVTPTGATCYFRTSNPPSGGAQLIEHPFNDLSASNRPIGKGAVFSGVSDPACVDLRLTPSFMINAGNSYGHRWTVGTGSDPLVHVTSNGVDDVGLPFDLRVPVGFTGGSTTTGDRGVTIWDAAAGVCSQFFQFYRTGNTTATAAGRYTVLLDGVDYAPPRRSSSASQMCQSGSIVRGAEVNPVSAPPIQHALGMFVGGLPSHSAMQASRNFIWPANGVDGYIISNPAAGQGHIDYGTLFAIPTPDKGGPVLETLNGIAPGFGAGTPQRLRFAKMARDYGLIMVDTGDNTGFRGDQYVNESIRTNLMASTAVWIPHLRRVTNNVKGTRTAGGGDPVTEPNCAYNAAGVTWEAS